MEMVSETTGSNGSTKSESLFKDIDERTLSYTFRAPNGLLSATQFTQPALTLMEKARIEDLKSRALIPQDYIFSGHSLGEFAALAALADVMPIENMISVVFYRGLTMQVAVDRDSAGSSNYLMCAINPSRVSEAFDEEALRLVVNSIAEETGWLLEIVNYNITNMQYAAAGDLRALDTLTGVIDFIKKQARMEEAMQSLKDVIIRCREATLRKPKPLELQRGFATIPLPGIDVPFHSKFLRPGIKPFRSFLLKNIEKSAIEPSCLVGKYIPNVTAQPFVLTKEYFENVHKLTNSSKIAAVLDNWDDTVEAF